MPFRSFLPKRSVPMVQISEGMALSFFATSPAIAASSTWSASPSNISHSCLAAPFGQFNRSFRSPAQVFWTTSLGTGQLGPPGPPVYGQDHRDHQSWDGITGTTSLGTGPPGPLVCRRDHQDHQSWDGTTSLGTTSLHSLPLAIHTADSIISSTSSALCSIFSLNLFSLSAFCSFHIFNLRDID